MTQQAARRIHDAALQNMLVDHPALFDEPEIVQRAYRALFPYVQALPLAMALDRIGRYAELLLRHRALTLH